MRTKAETEAELEQRCTSKVWTFQSSDTLQCALPSDHPLPHKSEGKFFPSTWLKSEVPEEASDAT